MVNWFNFSFLRIVHWKLQGNQFDSNLFAYRDISLPTLHPQDDTVKGKPGSRATCISKHVITHVCLLQLQQLLV